MPENDPQLAQTALVLADRWGVALPPGAAGPTDYDYLLEVLTERVSHLMTYRHQKLMASLYVLDVSERRYRAAMDAPTHAERAAALARAILERETEKIASRLKYAAPATPPLGPGAAS